MEEQTKCFSDMYLVAALLSYSPHSFCKVDKTDQRRQKFHFADTVLSVFILSPEGPKEMLKPTLDEICVWYRAGILMYKPDYPAKVKDVKSEVHI
jgi:hypothetical protein